VSNRNMQNRSATQVRRSSCLAAVLVVLALPGLAMAQFGLGILSPSGNSVAQKQATILAQRDQALSDLYAAKPELRQRIQNAAGYATFKKTDFKLFLVGTGNGYGVLVNNQTGTNTFMRVASLDGGLGVGLSDLRVVFIFDNASVMQQFATQGWQFGGSANATAQAAGSGVSAQQDVNANVDFTQGTVVGTSTSNASAAGNAANQAGATVAAGSGMQIYEFTQTGVSLQATVSGTKYWVDSDLND